MSASPPMSYPGLQCVMQYLEPNKKIEVSNRCPATRTADKTTPLRIQELSFHNQSFSIDKTKYQLGVIQIFSEDEGGDVIDRLREQGGYFDVNQYGCKDPDVLLPGDIGIPSVFTNLDDPADDKTKIERLESMLDSFDLTIEQTDTYSIILYFLKCQYKKRLPDCKFYIQFTITKPDGTKQREYLEYNKKIYEAMKYLCQKIFGGRNQIVSVGNMRFPPYEMECPFRVIMRLPQNFKLMIRGLEIGKNVEQTMKALQPLLDSTSFPLDKLKIDVIQLEVARLFPDHHDNRIHENARLNRAENCEHPVAVSAKSLHIVSPQENVLGMILEARNPNIRYDYYTDLNQLETIFDRFFDEESENVSNYSFGVYRKRNIEDGLYLLWERPGTWFEKWEEDDFIARVPLSDSFDVCVSFNAFPGIVEESDIEPKWFLQIYQDQRKEPPLEEDQIEENPSRVWAYFYSIRDVLWNIVRFILEN